MFSHWFNHRSFRAAAVLSVLAASTVLGQDRKLVTWTGRVDKEAQITIRDTTVSVGIIGGKPVTLAASRTEDGLPREAGVVRVVLNAGRGVVDVVQQPSAKNDYAAIIRIRDKSSGVDYYNVTAFWNPKRGEDRSSTAAENVSTSAQAMAPNTMHWSGTVDREMKVEWSGMDVRTRNQNGAAARAVHSSVSDPLPDRAVQVAVTVRKGRGDVAIVQQPTESNGYTVIFRIRDPKKGAGHYDFDATWQ